MTKDRDGFWDACKFVLVALVAIGHGMAEYMDYSPMQAYLYHLSSLLQMPAFAFISGLFTKNITGTKFKKFCISTIETYLVFQLFYMLYEKVDYTFIDFLLKPLRGNWFLLGLIIWKAFALWTSDMSARNKQIALILSVVLSIGSGFISGALAEYGLQRVLYLLPYFVFGTLVSTDMVKNMKQVKFSKLVAALYIIAVVVFTKMYYGHFFLLIQGSIPYSEPVVVDILYRTLLIANAIVLMFCFFVLMPSNPSRILVDLGSKTVVIYLYHQLVLVTVERLLADWGVFNGYIVSLCYIFVPLLVTIILTKFRISYILLRPITYLSDSIKAKFSN